MARILEHHGWPEHVVLAGLLHDVLEDIKPERKDLRDRLRAVVPQLRDASDEPELFAEAVAAYISETFGSDIGRLVRSVTEKMVERLLLKPPSPEIREAADRIRSLANNRMTAVARF